MLTCDRRYAGGGERATFQVMVHVGAAVPNGAVLHNTVTLTSTTPLTQSVLRADEDTRVLVPSGPLADLEVVKTVAPPVVQPGSLLTFTLVVTNNGPSPVNSAQLLDLLPDGLQLVRVAPSQGYCNAGISCLLGTLNYLPTAPARPRCAARPRSPSWPARAPDTLDAAGAHQHGLCPVGAAGPGAREQPGVGGGHRAARHAARRRPDREEG